MSAEVLRQAAALMRERAEAATIQSPSPWRSSLGLQVRSAKGTVACWDCCGGSPSLFEGTQDHIASWHPAVALAVADWLDDEAAHLDRLDGAPMFPARPQALAVAHTYLGADS